MDTEKKEHGSLRNRISASFFFMIVSWGIGVTWFFQQILSRGLKEHGLPAAVVLDLTREVTRLSTVLTIVGGIVVTVAIWIVSKILTRPIQLLTESVHKVAQGDLTASVLDVGVDELGELARDYNRMLEVLRRATVPKDVWDHEVETRLGVEVNLHRTEASYREMFENMKSAVVVYAPVTNGDDFIVKDFNRAAEAIERVSRDKVIGKSIQEAFPGVAAFGLLPILKRVWELDQPEYLRPTFYQDSRISGWRENYVYKLPGGEVVCIYDDISDRMRLEEEAKKESQALAASLDYLQSIIDAVADPIFVKDREHRWVAMNQMFCQFIGHSKAELLGKSDYEFFPKSEADIFWEKDEVVFREGKENINEEKFTDAKGFTHTIVTKKTLFQDASGAQVLVGIITDITQVKHAQEILAESEAKFRLLFQQSPVGYQSLDGQGILIEANAAWLQLLGYSRKEVIGRSFEDFLTPSARVLFHERFPKFKSSGIAKDAEFEMVRKNGEVIIVSIDGRSDKDESGQFKQSHCALRDVTERKRAEVAIAESEKQYRLLAENILDVIWIMDLNFHMQYVSPSIEKLRGFTVAEALTQTLPETLTPSSFELVQRLYTEEFEEEKRTGSNRGRARICEVEMTRKDGSTVWTEVKSSFLRNDAGQAISVIGITRDISERRRLNTQLIQSQKMDAVGKLAGGMAHDLNNILTVIAGYAELMNESETAQREFSTEMKEILSSTERAKALVRQLLAFSRREMVVPKVFNLNILVSDLEKMLKRLIPENIELRIAKVEETLVIKADPSQMEQVLVNFVVNARDAMPTGGKITIDAKKVHLDDFYADRYAEVPAGDYVMISVSDTGTGMTEEVKKHIFEPFFTTKPKDKGTGLGLATSYGIIRQSRGHVTVYSELGHGTVMKVYLPVEGGSVQDLGAQKKDEDLPKGNETILLAEDEMSLRRLASAMLKRLGYMVIEAENGAKALAMAREDPARKIDLLLTDIIMPEMGGRELHENMVRDRPGIKTLFVSGYTDDALMHQDVLSGQLQFLQKPFTQRALAFKIREILDQKS